MKKSLLFFCALALCSVNLFAQLKSVVPSKAQTSQVRVPMQAPPVTLKKIFSNLGPKTAAYAGAAWIVKGPGSGSTQFIAMPFTPKANSTVTQLQAAIQYNGSGANQVNLSLYSDNANTPGTLLSGPITVTNLPTYFTCCTVGVANLLAGVPVTAGTQYWVVADTPSSGTGSDFNGVWDFVPDSKLLVGANGGGSWFSFHASLQEPAGAVYGTIP